MTEIIFSGLSGGLLGSLITAIYTGLIERHRRRLELMSAVVGWVNEAYSRISSFFTRGRMPAIAAKRSTAESIAFKAGSFEICCSQTML